MTTLSEFKESLRSCSAPKLKVGDRVRVVRLSPGTDAKIGQIGTVREASNAPWIHFDEETGYALPIEELGIPAGFADCVSAEDLELVEETAPEPTPLAAFNQAAADLISAVEANATASDQHHARLMEGLDALESALESALAGLRAMRGGK